MAAGRSLVFATAMAMAAAPLPSRADPANVNRVYSKDGTAIAFECAGSGPELLIVHGGTGDRTRWTPMFAYLQQDFTVCAMDRRAHGQSADGPTYSLGREAEDIAAVVNSRAGPVAVLGHSFGGAAAYEAAFLTPRIGRLILYEPAIGLSDHTAVLTRMEELIRAGKREAATEIFMSEIVHISPEELTAMRARPAWRSMVASIEYSIRQDRALSTKLWEPRRAATLQAPTLLLIGSKTLSPELREAVTNLAQALPHRQVVVLEGQEHNAMDSDRDHLASVIRRYLQTAR